MYIKNIWIYILSTIIFLVPASEVVTQVIQYMLSKIIKPKLIPKMDVSKGIDEKSATMVVIPTILKSKEKVQELVRKLEVYYLANKTENLYFTLLGDVSESAKREEDFDIEIMEEGKKLIENLSRKYGKVEGIPIFNFIYRKREWNEKEGSYLGWERKRGMLTRVNEYLLGKIKNPFRVNTIEDNGRDLIGKIKYVITLDADTDLSLNSAFELVGAMTHILNKPVIDKEKNIVVDGYGIMQPHVGINLEVSHKTMFTKIFAGAGGIDSYTNAISNIYQDNFGEGIFTGKGIYDLNIYSEVLENQIPENMVLSHDLLEGCYLRCGLVSDILLMDGYPTKYNSFISRLSRWIRGDWQITRWLLSNSSLNLLSKYKIFDNLRRSLLEISIIFAVIYVNIVGLMSDNKIYSIVTILFLISIVPFILELLNHLIFKKNGEQKQKTFTPRVSGIKGIVTKSFIILRLYSI